MWMQEIKQAVRSFAKTPGFTLSVLLMLAVGVGATATVFSVVEALVLKKIPYKEPDRLVMLYGFLTKQNLERVGTSYLDLIDWRKENTVFTDLAAQAIDSRLTLIDEKGADSVLPGFISSTYFEDLGVAPSMGRTFTAEEERTPMAPHVAILSDGLWRNRFGKSPDIVGKNIRLNDDLYTIVGVMPPGFRDPAEFECDLWLPIMMVDLVSPDSLGDRTGRAFEVVGLLKPGVTIAQAQAEMNTISARLESQYPDSDKGFGVRVVPLKRHVTELVYHLPNFDRVALFLLLGSACVLLIACVNVASLFLVRATVRRREMGIRIAMGGGKKQIVRRLVIEGAVLSLIGGILGLMFAAWALKALLATGLITLPAYVHIALSPPVVALSLLLALATGAIAGMAPALQVLRKDLLSALHEGGREHGSWQSNRWRFSLIVGEVALAVILLVGAGLMTRSFRQLHGTALGFRTDNLLTARVDVTSPKYSEVVAKVNLAKNLEEGARALPGAQKVGIWGPGLPGATFWYSDVAAGERPPQSPREAVMAYRNHVSPDALSILGIPILKGRGLSAQDTADTPLVAVISQSLAKALWPGEDPLGKRFTGGRQALTFTVVGVVPDVRHRGRLLSESNITQDLYCSYYQYPAPFITVFLTGETDPAALAEPLRKMVHAIDRDVAIYSLETASQRLAREEAEIRLISWVMTFYAAMALTLAVLGIYGVIAYAVSCRINEIGVRMALGADRASLYRKVVGQALVPVLVGLVLGLAGAAAASRVISSLLYQMSATDPATFVGVSVAFLVVALLASTLPARRAMTIDPVKALR
jgi:predicted permease